MIKQDEGQVQNNEERDRSRERDRNRRVERQNRINSTSRDRRERNDRGRKASDRRIYVTTFFMIFFDKIRTEVGKVAHVELFTDENDKVRGCGIVEFEDSDSVKIAVEKMHQYDDKEDFDVERDEYGRLATARNNKRVRDDRFRDPPRPQGGGRQNMNAPAGGGGGGGGGDGGDGGDGDSKFGNTYGLSTQFLESLNINGPLVTRVFVANLDYKVDEKKLLEVFKLAGKVLHVELEKDKDGKSRGYGVVEYDHPLESVQAISMLHNQQLYDRRMTVKLDRTNEPDMPPKLPEGLKGIGMGLGAGGNRLMDVPRNIHNVKVNNPPVMSPMSALLLVADAFRTGLNNVPEQLGVEGLSDLQASTSQGNNSFARRDLSKMDNDVGFDGNNVFDGSNFAGGRNFDSRFNRGDSDCVPGGDGGFARNQDEGRGGNRQNTYDSRPMSDIILIRNLPPNTTWQMLRDKFQDVGEVKFAEMRETDMAIVQFASKRDAKRAVSMMNRSRIDGRTIDVCLY